MFKECVRELHHVFTDIHTLPADPSLLSSRSLYTMVVYLTGRRHLDDEASFFAGGETNLLENSCDDKPLYTDDSGNFLEGRKGPFASVITQRVAGLVLYQKCLMHEGADVLQLDAPDTNPYPSKKNILHSDVFFLKQDQHEHISDSGIDSHDKRCRAGIETGAEAERLLEVSGEFEEAGNYETAAALHQRGY